MIHYKTHAPRQDSPEENHLRGQQRTLPGDVVSRRLVLVTGIVQGVGFRPFVYELARRLGLCGAVRNRADGVAIEVEGQPGALKRFLHELRAQAPPLACINAVSSLPQTARGDETFRIVPSEADACEHGFIPADVATCDECDGELADPADRRFRYPFLNCTNCGPRFTIIRSLPYDRERTTMGAFGLCAACNREYTDPSNRRFHAQATACPDCGPRLSVHDALGRPIACPDALSYAVGALHDGRIVAIKGLGGYHLCCDARREEVVADLRRRKGRYEKPFAVMVADATAAELLVAISTAERRLLCSRRRPIVLLRRRPDVALADSVAPGNPFLGVMLPYTPLHHLLLRAAGGTPLVMTSGNETDEPIAYEDPDALQRLGGIADVFLTHDRAIHVRCDDSVMRIVAGAELPLRRARGYVPEPVPLPHPCAYPILALGGHLKATFALGIGGHAILSHHLGDLDHYEAGRAYREAIDHYEGLFGAVPKTLVHDLHPEYASTRYAQERIRNTGINGLAVQHHHAHLASCMAEHGLQGPVIGVIFDGAGLGLDGAIWGGEFLIGEYRRFRRAAHLRYVPMPGGEQATRAPWRMAVAYLCDAGEKLDVLANHVEANAISNTTRMIERRLNAPLTSSAGRLFDAVAALAGLRQRVSYEGQAALELEWLASTEGLTGHYPFGLQTNESACPEDVIQIDTRPLIAGVVRDVHNKLGPARIARRFHTTLVEIVVEVCRRIRAGSGLQRVVLSGGVFMNALLLTEVVERLSVERFQVYRHRQVPPNDGGLSLGQLAIAAAIVGDDSSRATQQGAGHVPWNSR